MNVKEIMDRVLFALSVPKCVCCGERLEYSQKAFCPECYAKFVDFQARNCSKCAKELNKCSCSNEFLSSHYVNKVFKCGRYIRPSDTPPINSLIYSLKRDNRKDVLDFASDILLTSINNSIDNVSDCIITSIPRRKSAIIKVGYDHSEMLAREIGRKSGAEYVSFLKSNAKRAQKSLDHIQRRKNAKFDLIKSKDLKGKKIIIIDDIITSGASMANAAMLIRSLGTKDIMAATLAIAYKDS